MIDQRHRVLQALNNTTGFCPFSFRAEWALLPLLARAQRARDLEPCHGEAAGTAAHPSAILPSDTSTTVPWRRDAMCSTVLPGCREKARDADRDL